MRKVTKAEIEKLYDFTRKHYVEYYDLQTELVDHLANGMEARWQENPHLQFEENLQTEFKKFGIFGFSEVVEKRKAAMEKKYFKLIFSEIKLILKQPNYLFCFVALILICRFTLEVKNGAYLLSGAALVFLILAFVKRQKVFFKKKKTDDRVFLLEEIIQNTGGLAIIFIFPFNGLSLFTNSNGNIENGTAQWIFALLMAFLALLAYTCFYTLPQKKEKILEKTYPQRKMTE
ncbi:MAG TPA: hypothetical protein VFM82_06575 [Flavobacteriaceae bacterium]|nr:hypothetical protein [Flavobacteriaceae bacterium]